MDAGVYGLASVYSITHPIDMNAPDEPVAPPQQSAEPAQAATAAPAGPMGFFTKKNGDASPAPAATTDGPISYKDLLERQAAQDEGRDVSLDSETKNVLEEAARKARESIFRSEIKDDGESKGE